MNGAELVEQVEALRNALHRNEINAVGRIFHLYKTVLGKKPRVRSCINCAYEALVELKQFGKQNISVNLPQPKQQQIQQIMLTKFNISKPFRPHGSPKVYTNYNSTDAEIEALLDSNPKLAGHVEVVAKSEDKPETETDHSVTEEQPEPAPKKRGRKAK